MSLEIIIIPLSLTHEPNATHICNTIKSQVKKPINIEIDTNYSTSIKTRIARYRKQIKDIITIDDDNINTNSITIRFAGSGNHPTNMPIQELIELISTLEDEYEEELEKQDVKPSEYEKNDEESNEGNCCIM